ncbi:MAG: glutamate--tRNA ligase [Candidatus Binatia bacterium]
MSVRSRFAPSPTGYLHIGGARTALFSYLFARGRGGKFILRIEDTDRERSTPESVQAILDGLGWLALEWDEGPFFQTQRMDRYRAALERLVASSRAYRCTCTAEELEKKRARAQAEGRRPGYDGTCRDRTDEPRAPYTIRFRAPREGATKFQDLIKGEVVFQNSELDDMIVARSDGTPVYNFCVVVDDAEMQVSHVIRGEDHVNNTPKQIHLYEALGYAVPEFAHVPLILGLDRSRLSKRHGATSVTAYRDMGYFPEALVNYLVRLGWSHGDQEIFTREELVEKFRVEDVGQSAGVFNPEKLDWVNAQYMKSLPLERLVGDVKPFLAAKGTAGLDDAWIAKMVATLRDRAQTLVELVALGGYYFRDEIELDEKAKAKFLKPEIAPVLRELRERLAALDGWDVERIKGAIEAVQASSGLALGKIAQPVRVAVTGGTASPGIFEVLDVLGREKTLQRLDRAIATLA